MVDLVGKQGYFKISSGKAWGQYSDKLCTVTGYDDDSRTGLFVEFEDGQRLLIQAEEFELIVN